MLKKEVFIFVLIKRMFHLSPGRTLLCLFSDFIQYQRRELCPWLISIIFLKSWFFMIYSKVTFQPSVGSETEDPVFQRGAVFIYAYQTVTSESNIKGRFFPLFHQPQAIYPAGALRLHQIVLDARQNLYNTGQKYQDNINPTTGQK